MRSNVELMVEIATAMIQVDFLATASVQSSKLWRSTTSSPFTTESNKNQKKKNRYIFKKRCNNYIEDPPSWSYQMSNMNGHLSCYNLGETFINFNWDRFWTTKRTKEEQEIKKESEGGRGLVGPSWGTGRVSICIFHQQWSKRLNPLRNERTLSWGDSTTGKR